MHSSLGNRRTLGASVLIGIFEGLFHLPLFFQPGSDQAAAGLPVFVIGSIAGAIVFLCSEQASYVAGAAWSVDGGTVQIII